METTNFDRLLQRYLTNQVTEEERRKIEIWLQLRKSSGAEEGITKEAQEALFKRITSTTEKSADFELALNRARRARAGWWLLRIAAVLLVGISLFFLGLYVANPDGPSTISGNGTEKVILQDGSIIWLRNQATLVYSENDSKRYVTLNGDAFFEVAKDAGRPFQVNCGAVVIEVTGTSFDVRNDKDEFELKVLTGSVKVSKPLDSSFVEVLANERLVHSAANGTVKNEFVSADVSEIIATTEYNMVFKNTPLAEVAERIGKKFNVRVTLENKDAGRCRVTADFTDKPLDTTMRMVTEILDLKYLTTTDGFVLSGEGCQRN